MPIKFRSGILFLKNQMWDVVIVLVKENIRMQTTYHKTILSPIGVGRGYGQTQNRASKIIPEKFSCHLTSPGYKHHPSRIIYTKPLKLIYYDVLMILELSLRFLAIWRG